MVNQRAMDLMNNINGSVDGTSWTQAKNLHEEQIRSQPIGQIYHSLTYGIRTMAGYAAQIPTEDRWAIASYVKALQRSQHPSPQDVAPERRGSAERTATDRMTAGVTVGDSNEGAAKQ